jgi:hypothetical protein
MNRTLPPLSAVPSTHGQLLSYRIRSEDSFPHTKFIAVLEYPDCTREHDGKGWRITQDKRSGAHV